MSGSLGANRHITSIEQPLAHLADPSRCPGCQTPTSPTDLAFGGRVPCEKCGKWVLHTGLMLLPVADMTSPPVAVRAHGPNWARAEMPHPAPAASGVPAGDAPPDPATGALPPLVKNWLVARFLDDPVPDRCPFRRTGFLNQSCSCATRTLPGSSSPTASTCCRTWTTGSGPVGSRTGGWTSGSPAARPISLLPTSRASEPD